MYDQKKKKLLKTTFCDVKRINASYSPETNNYSRYKALKYCKIYMYVYTKHLRL